MTRIEERVAALLAFGRLKKAARRDAEGRGRFVTGIDTALAALARFAG
jgi:hypothetical protein